jgi:cell division protein FtsQ
MKKTRSKRGSYDSGLDSVVLDAPEESFARMGAAVEADEFAGLQGRGPAPAGALQRAYGAAEADHGDFGTPGGPSVSGLEEPAYIPRRGSFRARVGGLPKSVGGRIFFGVVLFGALGAVGVAIAGVRYYVLHDQRFVLATSTDVQIMGDEHLSRSQVLSVFAGDLERNVFRVPLGERRADLERLPWVAHATVMRLLPNKIRVQIQERTPVAFVRQGTEIGLVDADGVLLDMPPETAGDPHYSFPVLTGLSANDAGSTRAARMAVYRQFMQELDSTGEHLTNSLSEVDVSNSEDVKALIASGNSDVLVHFGDESFLARYKEFEQHLPEWKQQYPKLASADMRYEGQIVLEMQGGAQAAGAAEAPAADGAVAGAELPAAAPEVLQADAPAAPAKPKAPAKTVAKTSASAAKRGAAEKRSASNAKKSVSNEKMFAALAAAQKAHAQTVSSKGGANQ